MISSHMFHTFHLSVQGSIHIQKGLCCEDASLSLSDPQNRYHILAVADGHGDPTCVRSQLGSLAAVSIAVESLQEFAESMRCHPANTGEPSWEDFVANPRYRQSAIRRLSNSILYRWSQTIQTNLRNHPLTDAEYEKAGEQGERYRKGENQEHIYGTTLIGGLLLPPFLILLQQGDGRCDVFYSDGSVDQPIPWDARCHENQATSLCDIDAADSVRSCVIDMRKKDVIACLMGSDGVEDSFFDMEGTHTFYRELISELCDKYPEAFLRYLKERLPELSRLGSGDDISVAGLVNIKEAQKFVDSFRRQIKAYQLNDSLKMCEERLHSMERKHNFLHRKVQELTSKLQHQEELLKEANEKKEKLEYCRIEWRRKKHQNPSKYPRRYPNPYWEAIEKQDEYRKEIESAAIALKRELNQQKDEYAAYDQKYRDIRTQRDHIRETIQNLKNIPPPNACGAPL